MPSTMLASAVTMIVLYIAIGVYSVRAGDRSSAIACFAVAGIVVAVIAVFVLAVVVPDWWARRSR